MRSLFCDNANIFFFPLLVFFSLESAQIGHNKAPKRLHKNELLLFLERALIKASHDGKERERRERGCVRVARTEGKAVLSLSLARARVIRIVVLRLRLVSHISLGEHETVKKRNQSV